MLGRIKIWQPEKPPQGSIIFLHGFGDSLRLWMPLAQKLALPYPLRMVFPEAPRVFAPHAGRLKRAWFVPTGDDLLQGEVIGIKTSVTTIGNLIRQEQSFGIPAQKIALVGFSQGGSLALLSSIQVPMAGAAAIAAFLRPEEINQAHHANTTSILMLHGQEDRIVPIDLGYETARHLKNKGLDVRWRDYERMGHELNDAIVAELRQWLLQILAP